MSSKIYFSNKTNARKPASYYLIKAVSRALHTISPRFALKQTRKLLLTPAKSKRPPKQPHAITHSHISSQIGQLALYRIGTGPKVILTHGWSGSAAQFFPLMEKIAQAGFEAVAFDHFAHGNSDEKRANLPLFIKGLAAVIYELKPQNIACLVSHSMGAVAALNQAKHFKHLLIAPAFNFYNSFEHSILSTGLTRKLFTNLMSEIEQEHQVRFDDLLPEPHLAQTQDTVHIVHDSQDRFAQYQFSAEQAKLYPHVTLTTTEGLGHGRVINSDHTWQAFMKLNNLAI